MLFEYTPLVAYRVGPSTTVGVRSVTAENLRESAATAKTIRCKTERPTTRPRTTSIQLTGQAKARQCADLSGAGTAVLMLGGAWAPKDPTGSVVCGVPLVIKGTKSLGY